MNQYTTTFELNWVIELAQEAGRTALKYYRHSTASWKPDNTIVTEADREIEQFLTSELKNRYPQDGILGEEGADYQRQAQRQWVLDPVDGTSVFSAGLPVWGISIGMMQDGIPAAGVIYLPVTGDCFAVDVEGPATLNGEPIQVAANGAYTHDSMLLASADSFRTLEIDFPGKVRAFGSCAAHFCYVAAGNVVGAINTKTSLWDIAAALPILQRAGGACTLMDGSPLPLGDVQNGAKFPQPLILAPAANLADFRSRFRYKTR